MTESRQKKDKEDGEKEGERETSIPLPAEEGIMSRDAKTHKPLEDTRTEHAGTGTGT